MRRWSPSLIIVFALILACSKKGATPMGPTTPACTLSAATLDFGTVATGASAVRQFTIQNTGGGTLSGTVNVSCAGFSIIDPPNYNLGAGQVATYHVQYTWQHAGQVQCAVATGASGCPSVSCTALGAANACAVVPATLSFGHVLMGATSDLQFVVTNNGTTHLYPSAYDTCADFDVIGTPAFDLAPGQSATYTIRFTPSKPGTQTCTIPLDLLCSVVCTGYGDDTPCYVTPLVLDFGTLRLNEYATRSFVVRNDGATNLSGRLDIPTTDNLCASLYLREGAPDYDLAPGASRSFLIAIQPRVITPQLSCTFSTGNTPCAQVTALATVTEPEFGSCSGWSVTPSSLDFGNVPIGQSVTRTIHLTAPADCVFPGARLDAIVAGPDFTFDDGTQVKHVSLDLAVNWTFDVRFAPTVVGEETFALQTFRACGPSGSSGFPCQGVLGRGAGVSAAASGASSRVWRPKPR